jgi:hypothetical protein
VAGGATAPIAVAIGGVVSGLAVAGAVLAIRSLRRSWRTGWGLVLVGCWLLVPPIVTLTISLVTPVFYPRYLIMIVPAIALLAAIPLGRLPSGRTFAAALIGLAVLGTVGVGLQAIEPSKEDWRSATQAVLRDATSADGIVFVSEAVATPFAFYALTESDANRIPTLIYPRCDWERPPPIATSQEGLEATIRADAGRFARVWLVVSHDSGGQGPVAMKLLSKRYALTRHEAFNEIDVWEYEPTTVPA